MMSFLSPLPYTNVISPVCLFFYSFSSPDWFISSVRLVVGSSVVLVNRLPWPTSVMLWTPPNEIRKLAATCWMLNRHYVRAQRAVKRRCWVLAAVGSALNETTVLQNAEHLKVVFSKQGWVVLVDWLTCHIPALSLFLLFYHVLSLSDGHLDKQCKHTCSCCVDETMVASKIRLEVVPLQS